MGNTIMAVEDHVTKKTTERGACDAQGIHFAASGMKGWRQTMEDSHTLCTTIPVGDGEEDCKVFLENHSLFAVYDGHGGDFTSGYAAENLTRILSKQQEWKEYTSLRHSGEEAMSDVNSVELLKSALRRTFHVLDEHAREIQRELNLNAGFSLQSQIPDISYPPTLERSGSTCVVVMLTPSHIICANAGDSRAILRRGGKVLPLSFDHKPSNVPELERIVDAGGFVKAKRVDGDLAVSRGLGDFSYKNNDQLGADRQKVTPDPHIVVYPRDKKNDEFLVLACDGVWDVATNVQCSDFIQSLLDEGESDVGLICEEAIDTCLQMNSRDNMTMVMVALPGMKVPGGPFASMRNVVWTRRASRKAKVLEFQAKVAAQKAAQGVGLDLGFPLTPAEQAIYLAHQNTTAKAAAVPGTNFCIA